jgi:hypothetical protein
LLVHSAAPPRRNVREPIMSNRQTTTWAVLLLATWFSSALAAPPAPQLSAGANGIKQLRFDWGAVSGATRYELWFQSSAAAAESLFFTMPATQRSVVNNVAVHLLDWSNARYWLKACDSSGCSSSPKISVANLMPDTIGLFSSPSQQTATQFGYAVALSRDGLTFAAVAPFEASSNPDRNEGSVYIYRKSGNTWPLSATIPLEGVQHAGGPSSLSDVRITLNGTGNVLAVGLPGDENSITQGDNQGACTFTGKCRTPSGGGETRSSRPSPAVSSSREIGPSSMTPEILSRCTRRRRLAVHTYTHTTAPEAGRTPGLRRVTASIPTWGPVAADSR